MSLVSNHLNLGSRNIEFQIRLLSVILECLKVSEVKEAAQRDVKCLIQIQMSSQNVCCADSAPIPTLAK